MNTLNQEQTIKITNLNQLRIVLVADNVSKKMGGEAGNNIYYFQMFKKRDIEVFVVCHSRVREEIKQEFPEEEDFQHFYFVEDTGLQKIIYRLGQGFSVRIRDHFFGQLLHLITQIESRKILKELIPKKNISILFEPSPITPKGLSLMYDLGIPVVIGPLSGGLDFPPAFQYMDSKLSIIAVKIGRVISDVFHRVFPGKLKADVLIVANDKTKKALPKGYRGKIDYLLESGVDLKIWQPRPSKPIEPDQPTRFVFVGRFVDWKGVEFLIDAFAQVNHSCKAVLELIGDGELRQSLETQVNSLNLQDGVKFYGWMKREDCVKILKECDVFVMPSIREAGGSAILEAMALGLPVIATNWAGPANILDDSCGILVEPSSKEEFVQGLAEAMIKLAQFPELCQQMGQSGIERAGQNYFDWDSKVNRIIEIFQEVLEPKKTLV